MSTINVKTKIDKRIYYNEDTGFGIYAIKKPKDVDFEVNKYGNVALQGTIQRLTQGEEYELVINTSPKTHQNYGTYYEIEKVAGEDLQNPEVQERFLREILTASQVESLRNAYPDENLVELILKDKIDVTKTHGIKDVIIDVIKRKVEQNLEMMELIAYLGELGVSVNRIAKINKEFGSPKVALDVIKRNIYELCRIKTFGFKTVDDIALNRGDDPKSSFRIQACVKHVLNENSAEGHTWMPESELLKKAGEMLELTTGTIEPEVNLLVERKVLYREMGSDLIALKYHIEVERDVLTHLLRIQSTYEPVVTEEEVAFAIANVQEETGMTFTDEQRTAIIKGSQHGVMIVNGVAGSGKTAVVKALIDTMGSLSYMTAALSGKAANVLANRGIKASTIHRMLGFSSEGGFLHNFDNPLPYSIVVLDEMSMINAGLILSAVEAVADGAKLILVGDSGQLPAIGYGDVLRDLLATDLFPKYELTQVHRQAAKSGILSIANTVRHGEQVAGWGIEIDQNFGELQDQRFITYRYKDQIVEDVINISKQYKEANPNREANIDFQIIVSNKERGNLSTKHLNNTLQPIFNPSTAKQEGVKWNGYEFKTHDKIMIKGNTYGILTHEDIQQYTYRMAMNFKSKQQLEDAEEYYETADLFNGSMGFIEMIDKTNKNVLLNIEGVEGLVSMTYGELDALELAYASTVHRMQGSGIPIVLFALDYGAYKLLSRQLVYTALTRASKRGIVLAENDALYTAIKTDASNFRRTRLQHFINQVQLAEQLAEGGE